MYDRVKIINRKSMVIEEEPLQISELDKDRENLYV